MLHAEFTVEPFRMGKRGAHGAAALAVVEGSGLRYDDGPFGTSIDGPAPDVRDTLSSVIDAAMAAGAVRVSVQITRPEPSR